MTAPDFLESQLYLYRLLSALYRYPLTGEKLAALAAVNLADDSPLAQALGELQATVDGADDAALERLNVEMTRLLEGPGVTPAVPYASYYLNGKQLMGPAAQAARRAYLEWGVEPEQGGIPPDHIALELGFLSFLAEQALEEDRREDALRASLAFLREHVEPWLPSFCAALETSANEPFFRALAAFTRQAVEQLIELLPLTNKKGETSYENV
jgi:TorA maturation chaperone TorD